MRGYGISPDLEGLLPWSWAERRLTDAHVYLLSTVRPDGAPHAAPLWAVWHDGAVVFSTGGHSRKARNLDAEPRCAVTVGDADETVILEGAAARFTGSVDGLAAAYAAKYGEAPPPDSPWYAVAPIVVFGFVERDGLFTSTATRWTPGLD
jgi:hypothetical protein